MTVDIKNKLIGKNFVAQMGEDCPHAQFDNGNDGEKNYYRDVWGEEGLLYCFGESCEVLDVADNFITLKNEEEDLIFTISLEQFICDFLGNNYSV